MKYDPKIHHRRSIRLRGYDYSSPGAYYVTLCSFRKQCIFGRVVADQMQENECGKIVREEWFESARIRRQLELDAFTVMPNHLHGILWIVGPSGARPQMGAARMGPSAIRPHELRRTPSGPASRIPAMRPHSLASWAAGFKSAITSRVRECWKRPDASVWQEDYFEHIIRDEAELLRIRDYILSNPARWSLDRENPKAGPDVEDEWPWNPEDAW